MNIVTFDKTWLMEDLRLEADKLEGERRTLMHTLLDMAAVSETKLDMKVQIDDLKQDVADLHKRLDAALKKVRAASRRAEKKYADDTELQELLEDARYELVD